MDTATNKQNKGTLSVWRGTMEQGPREQPMDTITALDLFGVISFYYPRVNILLSAPDSYNVYNPL